MAKNKNKTRRYFRDTHVFSTDDETTFIADLHTVLKKYDVDAGNGKSAFSADNGKHFASDLRSMLEKHNVGVGDKGITVSTSNLKVIIDGGVHGCKPGCERTVQYCDINEQNCVLKTICVC